MRGKLLIATAATIAATLPFPATAAPAVFVAGGPLRPPGGFSQQGMHPVFTSCSLADFSTTTSTTIATLIIRPNTNDAHFEISNRCGTYDETFRMGDCTFTPPTNWNCFHIRSDGFRAEVDYRITQGQPHLFATEYNTRGPEFFTVVGYLLVSGVTS